MLLSYRCIGYRPTKIPHPMSDDSALVEVERRPQKFVQKRPPLQTSVSVLALLIRSILTPKFCLTYQMLLTYNLSNFNAIVQACLRSRKFTN